MEDWKPMRSLQEEENNKVLDQADNDYWKDELVAHSFEEEEDNEDLESEEE